MANEISRRGFLKGVSTVALAAAASGLLGGCSEEVDSGFTLGEYKIYFEKGGYSWGGSAEEESGYVYPTVKVKGLSNGATSKALKDVFSATADGTELTLKNRAARLNVVQGVATEVLPQFAVEDEDLYKNLQNGKTMLELSVTLSAKMMVFAVNIKTGTATVKKAAVDVEVED